MLVELDPYSILDPSCAPTLEVLLRVSGLRQGGSPGLRLPASNEGANFLRTRQVADERSS